MSARSGIGYDSHRLAPGRPLVLGGVRLPGAEQGLVGHSDADVLTHAVMDALLGGAGLGDIGQRYPDGDERWRDADSLDLLSEVATFLEEHGFDVTHVDATVICEAPKLGPFRAGMQEALALASGCGSVNVKFTTNEGMGFVGRGEGIAAMAVATVRGAS